VVWLEVDVDAEVGVGRLMVLVVEQAVVVSV
jgi:hypothetical protein